MQERTPKPTNGNETPSSKPLAEGKTKIIYAWPEIPNAVRIVSKDDITAKDGTRRDILPGKGALATQTTVNVFKLLRTNRIPTHFLLKDTADSFIAYYADMIPLECVARRIAAGSYLKRNPEIQEGQRLDSIPVEFYFKDDSRHDPIVQYDRNSGEVLLFDAKEPNAERSPIGEMTLGQLKVTADELIEIKRETRRVFKVLETAWGEQGVTLVDLKIEFGKDTNGNIMVADVIDNDSWRIWPGGDKSRMMDNKRYRDGDDLESILKDYRQVAEMTRNFVYGG